MRVSHLVLVPVGFPGNTLRLSWLAALFSLITACEQAPPGEPPYPASSLVVDVRFEERHQATPDRAGDNWPLTWGDDERLYTAWGDGQGPDHPDDERLSMGFAYVEGEPFDARVVKISSPHEQHGDDGTGPRGYKASGMLMVDGVLYMWVRNDDRRGRGARLWWSTNRGRDWTRADWSFPDFGYPTFINFGPDYSGARDEYVYTVSHDDPSAYTYADDFVLMRVPRDEIRDREAYEFFRGLDDRGDPHWTSELSDRESVFHHPGRAQRSSITYNRYLDRYLWWQAGWPNPDGSDSRFETGPFGIYEAPEPWGPWHTVRYWERFPGGPGETGAFPARWMEPPVDGEQIVHMVTSTDDAFSVWRVRFVLASD